MPNDVDTIPQVFHSPFHSSILVSNEKRIFVL